MLNDLFEFRITSPPSIWPLQSLRTHSSHSPKHAKAQGKVHPCSPLFLLLLIHSVFPTRFAYPATAAQAVLSQFPVLLINFATHSSFPHSHLIQDAISVAVCVCVCVCDPHSFKNTARLHIYPFLPQLHTHTQLAGSAQIRKTILSLSLLIQTMAYYSLCTGTSST